MKTNKTNSKLSFWRRDLKDCPEKLKQTAYFSLIRSFMEYVYQKYNSWDGSLFFKGDRRLD